MSSELQNISIKSRSIDFNSLTGINFSSGSGITYGSQFSKQSIDLNNVSLSGNLDLSNVVLSGNINTQFISSIFDINQDSMLDYETSKSTSDQYGATYGVTYGDNLGSINAGGALNGTENGGYVGPIFNQIGKNEYSEILNMKYLVSSNTNSSVPDISLNGSQLLKNITTKSYNINSADDIKKGRQTVLNDPLFLIEKDSYFGNLYTLTNNANPIVNQKYTDANIIYSNILYDEFYYVRIPDISFQTDYNNSIINVTGNCNLYNKTKKSIYDFQINAKVDDENIDTKSIMFFIINGFISQNNNNIGNLNYNLAFYESNINQTNNISANLDISIQLFNQQYNYNGNVTSNFFLQTNLYYIDWFVPNTSQSKDVVFEFPQEKIGYNFPGFNDENNIIYFNNNYMTNSAIYYNSLTPELYGNLIENIYTQKMSIYNADAKGNIIYVNDQNKNINLDANITLSKIYIDFPNIAGNIKIGDIFNLEEVYKNYSFDNPRYTSINADGTRFVYKNIDTWVRYKNINSYNYDYTDYIATNNFSLLNYNGLSAVDIIEKAWYVTDYTNDRFSLVSGSIDTVTNEKGLEDYEATYLFLGPFSVNDPLDPTSSIFTNNHTISYIYKGGSEKNYDYLTLAYYDFKEVSTNCIYAFDINRNNTNKIPIYNNTVNEILLWGFNDFNYNNYPNAYVTRNNMLMDIEGIYLYYFNNEIFVMNSLNIWKKWNETNSKWELCEQPINWTEEVNNQNIYALIPKTNNITLGGYNFEITNSNRYKPRIINIDPSKSTNYYGIALHKNSNDIYYYQDVNQIWHLLSDNAIVSKPSEIDIVMSSFDAKHLLVRALNPKPYDNNNYINYNIDPTLLQSSINYITPSISQYNDTNWQNATNDINFIDIIKKRIYVFFYMKDGSVSYIPDAYQITDIIFTPKLPSETKLFERGWHFIKNYYSTNIADLNSNCALIAGFNKVNSEYYYGFKKDIINNKMRNGDKTYFVIGPISPITDFNKNILKYIYFEFEYSVFGIRNTSIFNAYKIEKDMHNSNYQPVFATEEYIRNHVLNNLENPFFQLNENKNPETNFFFLEPDVFKKFTSITPVFNTIYDNKVVFYVFEYKVNQNIPSFTKDEIIVSEFSIVYLRNIKFTQQPIENDNITFHKKTLPISDRASLIYKNSSKYFPNLELHYQFEKSPIYNIKLKNENFVSITGNIVGDNYSNVKINLSLIKSNINGNISTEVNGNIIFKTSVFSISNNQIVSTDSSINLNPNLMNGNLNLTNVNTCSYYNNNFYKFTWHADNSLFNVKNLAEYTNNNNEIFNYPFYNLNSDNAILVAGLFNTFIGNSTFIENPLFKKQICFLKFSFNTLNDTRSFIIGFNYQLFSQRRGDFFYFQYSTDGGKTYTDLLKQSGNINTIRSVNDNVNIAWKNVSYYLPSGFNYTFRWVFYKITDFSQYYNTVVLNNLYITYLNKTYDDVAENLKIKTIDTKYITTPSIMGTKNIDINYFDYYIDFYVNNNLSKLDKKMNDGATNYDYITERNAMFKKKNGFIDNLLITPFIINCMDNYPFVSKVFNPFSKNIYHSMNSYYYSYALNNNNTILIDENTNIEISKKCWRIFHRDSLQKYKFYDKSENIPDNINSAAVVGSFLNSVYEDNWGAYLLLGPFNITDDTTNKIMIYDTNITFDYFGNTNIIDHLVFAVIDIYSDLSLLNKYKIEKDIVETLSSSSVKNNNATFYRNEYDFTIKNYLELNSETIWKKANNGYGVDVSKVNKDKTKYRYLSFYYIKNETISEGIDSWAIANINITLTTPGINKNTFQFLNFQDIIVENEGSGSIPEKQKVSYLNLIKNEKDFIRIPFEHFKPEIHQILYLTNNVLDLIDLGNSEMGVNINFSELYVSPSYNQTYSYTLLNQELININNNAITAVANHWKIEGSTIIFLWQNFAYDYYNNYINKRAYRLKIKFTNMSSLINPDKTPSYERYVYIFIESISPPPYFGAFKPSPVLNIDTNVIKQRRISEINGPNNYPTIWALFTKNNNIGPININITEEIFDNNNDDVTKVKYIVSSPVEFIVNDIQFLNKITITNIPNSYNNATLNFDNNLFYTQPYKYIQFNIDKIIQKTYTNSDNTTFTIDSFYYSYPFRLYKVSEQDYQAIETFKIPTLTNFPDIIKKLGDSNFTLMKPSSNSMGYFTFLSSNTDVATIDFTMGYVTLVNGGTTQITATQNAYGNFGVATLTATLTVSSATLSNFPNIYKLVDDPDFTLTPPTSNSLGNFTYTSSNIIVATVDFYTGIVNLITEGTTTITATQESYGDLGMGIIRATLTVLSQLITPTLSNFSNINKYVGDPDFDLPTPISNSNGAFTYSSSNTNIAAVNENTGIVTIYNAGMTLITATQQSYNNYGTASISAYLFVSNNVQNEFITPTLSNFPDIYKTLGSQDFDLTTPSSNSNGVFTYTSSNTNVADVGVNSGVVTIYQEGTTTITATQSASGNYGIGTIYATLTVYSNNNGGGGGGGDLTTPSLSLFPNIFKTLGSLDFMLTPPNSNSNGAFTYTSSMNSVATVNFTSGLVSIIGVGMTTITATQDADGIYGIGSISATLTVSSDNNGEGGGITPILSNFSDIFKTLGSPDFMLTPPNSNSNGVITYTSSDTNVATINIMGTVTILSIGNTIITATQAAHGMYGIGTITATLNVTSNNNGGGLISPNISFFSDIIKILGDNSFYLTPPNSNSTGNFIYTSSDTDVAVVDLNTGVVMILSEGITTITATQAADGIYGTGSISATLTILSNS
jgi:hypothetical protein